MGGTPVEDEPVLGLLPEGDVRVFRILVRHIRHVPHQRCQHPLHPPVREQGGGRRREGEREQASEGEREREREGERACEREERPIDRRS